MEMSQCWRHYELIPKPNIVFFSLYFNLDHIELIIFSSFDIKYNLTDCLSTF